MNLAGVKVPHELFEKTDECGFRAACMPTHTSSVISRGACPLNPVALSQCNVSQLITASYDPVPKYIYLASGVWTSHLKVPTHIPSLSPWRYQRLETHILPRPSEDKGPISRPELRARGTGRVVTRECTKHLHR